MIFEALYESAKRGELLLIDGGYVRFHIRRDRQMTILEIISTRRGAGSVLWTLLLAIAIDKNVSKIVAKCPADLEANSWYQKKNFVLDRTETTKSGRGIRVWAYHLP
jgi:hypothetical protein